MKKICVLGRGKSLIRYQPQYWNHIYMVNNMTEEIKLIHPREFTEKTSYAPITHVTGRKGATVIDETIYEIIKPYRIISNAISEDKICNIKRYGEIFRPIPRPKAMNIRGYKPIGWKAIYKGKNGKLKSDNGNAWPTTGLFAIDLALTEKEPEQIWLYGFDCYREKYLVKDNRPYQTQDSPKIKMMYVYLRKLVQEFNNTIFYCASKLPVSAHNWQEI